ncbi:hypothetical protein J3R82DRAFT_9899 [Butyriboletus roseoflavus]|nr:hypothetical protein J3R82DRAFT_9899 [Butyriboletus roseoflavus]
MITLKQCGNGNGRQVVTTCPPDGSAHYDHSGLHCASTYTQITPSLTFWQLIYIPQLSIEFGLKLIVIPEQDKIIKLQCQFSSILIPILAP